MARTQDAFHPTRFSDLAVTVDFHCNSACRFCIVQEGMNRYEGLSPERFRAAVEENRRTAKYRRLILTGGEVTLSKRLFEMLETARGAFEHVRIQTNARRLASAEHTRALVDAGVDELFVSIHGHDAATQDDISQRPGSFAELLAGMTNAREAGVLIVTNTVMTRRNLHALAHIPALVAAHGATAMELWNYLPMEDAADERDLIAPMSELAPALLRALDAAEAAGLPCTTKYVPKCMLGRHGATLDNGQPDVVIVEDFWEQFPRFGCLYEAVCDESDDCLGLHHPYVNKYGWEADALRPVPRERRWTPRSSAPSARRAPEDAGTSATPAHPAWLALIDGAIDEPGVALERVELERTRVRYTFAIDAGGVEIVLSARDDAQAALGRSRSFNLYYTRAHGADDVGVRAKLERLLAQAVRVLGERDDGSLTLDDRKGLVQLLPPRRRPRR